MSKESYFVELLSQKIQKFDDESNKHKNRHRQYRYGVFALAAITSILSGAALGFTDLQTELNFMIVIIGAIAGVLTSIEGLRRPHDLWIMERNVHYSLLDLKEEYEFKKHGNESVDVDLYFERLQLILNASKQKWTKKVSKPDSNSSPKNNLI